MGDRMPSRLDFLDFFGGAGGWSLGLSIAGLRHCGHFDYNASACNTARSNLGEPIHCVDLMRYDVSTLPQDVQVVVGSPPCQGFSNEGHKKEDDPRNMLVRRYIDIIEVLRPKVWVFENVPGFKRSYGGRYYRELIDRVSSMGYDFADGILNSADYGVPQRRQRFFLIAGEGFSPQLPQATHGKHRRATTLWEAISDLPKVAHGERGGVFEYPASAGNPYQVWMREGSDRVENHTTQNHSERVLEKIKAVPAGGDMRSFAGRYKENKVAYCGGYRRAVKDTPSFTAYWTRGMASIHPEQDRLFSPRECARIQSFPDRFVFCGTTIENYTQVCNAVPPLMAYAFGREIRRCIMGEVISEIPFGV